MHITINVQITAFWMVDPPGQLTSRQLPPMIIVPEEYCRLTIKFPPKITAPFPANSPQRVLRVKWGNYALSTSTTIKESFYQKLFFSQKWFISIYFLQILTKPCRTPLKREQFSLNTSWFPYARTQKKPQFLWKIGSEKCR